MAGKLLLALELVRSLKQHDISTPNGNLVNVLITGDLLPPTPKGARPHLHDNISTCSCVVPSAFGSFQMWDKMH